MEEILQELKITYPTFKFDKKENAFYEKTLSASEFIYYISGLIGNPGLRISISSETKLLKLKEFLEKEIQIFPDFVAVKKDNTIEVLLSNSDYKLFRLNDRDEEI